MPKRTTHQVPVAEKIAKLRTWQKYPEWAVKGAVQNRNVKRGTLIGWRNQYSDPQLKHIRVPPDVGNRIREKGGGRKHRTTSYEFDVLSFYDNCAREGEIPSHASILSYCQNIPEFALKKDKSQHSWVREFIKRYKTHHSSKTNSNSASNYKVCQAEDAESDNDPIPVSPTNDTFTSDIMTQNTTVSDERTTPGNLEDTTADKQDIFHSHDIDSTISVNCSTPSPGQPESGSEDSSNDVSAASESDDSSNDGSAASESDDSNNDVSAASESSEPWCSNSDSETIHSKMILRSGKRKGCTTNSIVFTYEKVRDGYRPAFSITV
ncbi:hypothetical protein PPTG_19312 [Phytophthora nicotianae INRA-310]|uniref:Uncharacterized protein n=2 Tax=Phytophthora nicotianae TaxID=4792 RepID=W2PD39_PHYN3|nr:hypothetical protein PPTG_19312 [Phytophthora nicotianae INRA-310]ETM98751.1 hypothetical protein PPTG_19312 [Phytophthora nicotianae INRA-310]